MVILISEEKIKEHLARVQIGEVSVAALCREIGVSKTTFYSWRKTHGPVNVEDYPELKVRLKKNVSDHSRDLEEKQISSLKRTKVKKKLVVAREPVQPFTIDDAVIASMQTQSGQDEPSLRSLIINISVVLALVLVAAYVLGYPVRSILPQIQYEQKLFVNAYGIRYYEVRKIKDLHIDEEKISYALEEEWVNPARFSKTFKVYEPSDCRFLHAKTWACAEWGSSISMADGVLMFDSRETQKQLVFIGLRLNLP